MGGARCLRVLESRRRHCWKARHVLRFRSGFLGISTLGWSTLVQIVEASEDDRLAAIDTLAKQLVANFGAPTIDDAVAAAEEEISFAESLCTQPQDTLIAVHRTFEDGSVRESFRTLRPRNGPKPARAFSFLEVEGEQRATGRAGRPDCDGRPGAQMNDFWISSGHHLLDRDQGGGLSVTDEFLKLYLARPELLPPPEACAVERTLHACSACRSATAGGEIGHCRNRGSGRARELAISDRTSAIFCCAIRHWKPLTPSLRATASAISRRCSLTSSCM